MVTHIYKIRSEIWVATFPQKFGGPKNIKISATSRLDREYLPNATRYRQSENSAANDAHSRKGKLNLVYFGPHTAKNMTGVLTQPPATVQRTGDKKSVACDK